MTSVTPDSTMSGEMSVIWPLDIICC